MAEPCSSVGSQFDSQGLSWAHRPEASLEHRGGFQKFFPLPVVAVPSCCLHGKMAKKPTLADCGPFEVFWAGKSQDPHGFKGFSLLEQGRLAGKWVWGSSVP